MRKTKKYLQTNRRPSKKKLDPTVKVAIIVGIFEVIVILLDKLL